MKSYRVPRSITGSLGPLRRNQVLQGDDPRITENATAVKDLLKRGLLVEQTAEEAAAGKAAVKGGRKPNAE